jgi:hypothetical protein
MPHTIYILIFCEDGSCKECVYVHLKMPFTAKREAGENPFKKDLRPIDCTSVSSCHIYIKTVFKPQSDVEIPLLNKPWFTKLAYEDSNFFFVTSSVSF